MGSTYLATLHNFPPPDTLSLFLSPSPLSTGPALAQIFII